MPRPSVLASGGATALILGLLAAQPAHATNGYFVNSCGAKSQGKGGVAYALSDEALALAANPAAAFGAGDRAEVGLTWFAPERGARISGNETGTDADYDGNDRRHFFIPQVGVTRRINERLAWGLAVCGNGGMNTSYKTTPFERYGVTGEAGVNLEQLFVKPTLAYAITPDHVVGVSLNVVYQRFEGKGLALFGYGEYSQDNLNLSDNGIDHAFGVGVSVGWQGRLTPWLRAGASWQSKTKADKFDKYAGLFADGGNFDVPETYGAGIVVEPNEKLQIGFDVQRILYSDVPSVGNTIAPLLDGVKLGAKDGPGFGWRDITVYKLGAEYKVAPHLQVRAGYSRTDQPVPADQTFFNILAPGVTREHFTAGATLAVSPRAEVSAYLSYSPKETVKGVNSIPASFGGGNADVHLKQVAAGISYSYRFGN